MNKYKIYIIFILIFILTFIPQNDVYGDNEFLLKTPSYDHLVTREECYVAMDFSEKNLTQGYLDKWAKASEEYKDEKTKSEIHQEMAYYQWYKKDVDYIKKVYNPKDNNELKLLNAQIYILKYINDQKEGEADAKFVEQKKFEFLSKTPNKTVTEDQYDKAKEFCDHFDKFNNVNLGDAEEQMKLYYTLTNGVTDSKNIINIQMNKLNNARTYVEQYEKENKEKNKKENKEKNKKDEYKTNISTDITDGNFIKQFSLDDKNNNNGPIEPILSLIQYVTGIVLGIIQVFSGFLMVVTIAYTGFKMILSTDANNNGGLAANLGFDDLGNSSPAGQKRLQEFMQHLMIGTVITFTSTTIARAIFKILTKV